MYRGTSPFQLRHGLYYGLLLKYTQCMDMDFIHYLVQPKLQALDLLLMVGEYTSPKVDEGILNYIHIFKG